MKNFSIGKFFVFVRLVIYDFVEMAGVSRMNKFGGTYDRGVAFPIIKQKQISIDYFTLNENVAETAKRNRCSTTAVYNVFNRFVLQGHLQPLPKGRPQAKLDEFVVSFLVKLVDEFPKATLPELQLMLTFYLDLEEFEIPLEESIYQKLIQLGLTMKHVSPIADRRLSPESRYCRSMFITWRNNVGINRVFFID